MGPKENNVKLHESSELENEPESSLSEGVDFVALVNCSKSQFELWEIECLLFGEHYCQHEYWIDHISHDKRHHPNVKS